MSARPGSGRQAGEASRLSTIPTYGLARGLMGAPSALPGLIADGDTLAVAVGYGDDEEDASLTIETSRPIPWYGGGPLRVVAEYVWRKADGWSALPSLRKDEAKLLDRVTTTTVSIDIEGDETPTRIVRDGEEWVGRAYHQGWRITLESRGLEPEGLRLVVLP